MGYLPNLTQISDALGWAVLHSLWQGALAAVLVWVFRNITRESAADTRYMFGFVTLCSLLVAFIGTFLYYYSLGSTATGVGAQLTEIATLPLTGNTAEPLGNPLLRVTEYTGLVGAIWAGCFALLGLRYLSAFRLTHKLRTTGLTDLPSNWQENFNELAKRSNVTGKVRGFISEHVSSPITFGFWKPIVLVPAWFFSGLTPEQCEAVLLHEFAHIRRHDYITNILKILVKTVLFYHPAVQYISKVMDTDREHACDDFAVLVTNSPEMLAKALGTIRLKAARDGGVFALSADGPEAPLMHRLKRLMGAPIRKTHSGSGRGFAATLMIAISSSVVLGLSATESLAHPHKPDTEVLADKVTADTETLAGASESIRIQALGSDFNNKIIFKGETYKATSFDYREEDGYDVINGKKYPSKYMYSVYAKDGISYVVKKKDNGKKYIEIGEDWFRIDKELTTSQKYAYSTTTIDGHKYKTKTNAQKNQTFISVNGNWYDIDEANLDRLIPTPSVAPTPPVPPKYSYTYAYKDGQKYKLKTKNKTGKTYIKIDGNWQKVATKGGGDHGHKHVNIDGKWVNINSKTPVTPATPPAPTEYRINEEVRLRVEEAVARATEQRVQATERQQEALERVEEQRERAQEQRMASFERATEQRERALERAERQREEALDRAEEQRERAEEQRERNLEQVERDREQLERNWEQQERNLERAQEQRERVQEQRMASIERAQEQRERSQERAERQRNDKKMVNYEEMRDRLIPVLKADGYLPKKSSTLVMKMTKDDIFINGKLLASAQEGKYCDIVSHYGMRKDDVKRITIKPDSFHISSTGDHGNTRVTIGTFSNN